MSSPSDDPKSSLRLIQPYGGRDVSKFYSHSVVSAPSSVIVTTAGQVGADAEGNVPKDAKEQVKLAFKNLTRCLEASGAAKRDIMKLTYYIVNYDPSNLVHREPLLAFLEGHRPAADLIPVPALARPEYLFEVTATAAIPQSPLQDVDVVIVGAGLSGLQAARDVQKAGLSCAVLEARDRVGGKTWSQPVHGAKVDVGAAWINDTNQSRMFSLAQEFNLTLVPQNTEGKIIIEDRQKSHSTHPYGTLVPKAEEKAGIEDMIRIRDLFETICQKLDVNNLIESAKPLNLDLHKMTFEEFIHSQNGGEVALDTAKIWTRAMLGLEPSEMSALYFLSYCKSAGGLMQMRSDRKDGGQYLRVQQGTQSFSQGLASQLHPGTIHLSSPVLGIDQTGPKVHITSSRGTYTCKRVIISIPTPLYTTINFNPPLPPLKANLSSTSQLGKYCKMILLYSRPWWRTHGLCGLSQSPLGPFAVTRDTSVDALDHYSLTCFVVGEPARQWAKLPAQQRREAVLEQIQRLFGPAMTGPHQVEEPIDIVEQDWQVEHWSRGAPCPVPPVVPGDESKTAELMAELTRPVGRCHFVGTETADVWRGYMEGAVRSGQRGAEEVVKKLSAAKL